jgi:hypothetical protein
MPGADMYKPTIVDHLVNKNIQTVIFMPYSRDDCPDESMDIGGLHEVATFRHRIDVVNNGQLGIFFRQQSFCGPHVPLEVERKRWVFQA